MKRVELDGARVRALAGAVQNARVCMISDVCLDLYWRADMRLSRLSRETPHFPLPVVGETASRAGRPSGLQPAGAFGVGETDGHFSHRGRLARLSATRLFCKARY